MQWLVWKQIFILFQILGLSRSKLHKHDRLDTMLLLLRETCYSVSDTNTCSVPPIFAFLVQLRFTLLIKAMKNVLQTCVSIKEESSSQRSGKILSFMTTSITFYSLVRLLTSFCQPSFSQDLCRLVSVATLCSKVWIIFVASTNCTWTIWSFMHTAINVKSWLILHWRCWFDKCSFSTSFCLIFSFQVVSCSCCLCDHHLKDFWTCWTLFIIRLQTAIVKISSGRLICSSRKSTAIHCCFSFIFLRKTALLMKRILDHPNLYCELIVCSNQRLKMIFHVTSGNHGPYISLMSSCPLALQHNLSLQFVPNRTRGLFQHITNPIWTVCWLLPEEGHEERGMKNVLSSNNLSLLLS